MDQAELWTAAGVLLGFQVTSFLWRVGQEAETGANGKRTWLPPADMLNLLAMSILAIGVFVWPSVGTLPPAQMRSVLGTSALLFVGHAFSLAGHYEMYNRYTTRSFDYFPIQERVAVVVTVIATIGYVLLVVL